MFSVTDNFIELLICDYFLFGSNDNTLLKVVRGELTNIEDTYREFCKKMELDRKPEFFDEVVEGFYSLQRSLYNRDFVSSLLKENQNFSTFYHELIDKLFIDKVLEYEDEHFAEMKDFLEEFSIKFDYVSREGNQKLFFIDDNLLVPIDDTTLLCLDCDKEYEIGFSELMGSKFISYSFIDSDFSKKSYVVKRDEDGYQALYSNEDKMKNTLTNVFIKYDLESINSVSFNCKNSQMLYSLVDDKGNNPSVVVKNLDPKCNGLFESFFTMNAFQILKEDIGDTEFFQFLDSYLSNYSFYVSNIFIDAIRYINEFSFVKNEEDLLRMLMEEKFDTIDDCFIYFKNIFLSYLNTLYNNDLSNIDDVNLRSFYEVLIHDKFTLNRIKEECCDVGEFSNRLMIRLSSNIFDSTYKVDNLQKWLNQFQIELFSVLVNDEEFSYTKLPNNKDIVLLMPLVTDSQIFQGGLDSGICQLFSGVTIDNAFFSQFSFNYQNGDFIFFRVIEDRKNKSYLTAYYAIDKDKNDEFSFSFSYKENKPNELFLFYQNDDVEVRCVVGSEGLKVTPVCNVRYQNNNDKMTSYLRDVDLVDDIVREHLSSDLPVYQLVEGFLPSLKQKPVTKKLVN